MTHLDVGGVYVARIVLLVGYELHPVLLVRDDVPKTVALCVFRQRCSRDDTVRPLLRHLFVLCEDAILLQL